MTQNFLIQDFRDPIDSGVPCPHGIVLPASGNPFLVVFQIFTWDPPTAKFCVYSNFTHFYALRLAAPVRAVPTASSYILFGFIRFTGLPCPNFVIFSQHILNLIEYTLPNASHISHTSKPSRVSFRYNIFSSHPQRAFTMFKYS